MNHFSFKFQNVRVAWYVIGGFLVSALLVFLAVIFDIVNLPVMLTAMFAPMITAIWIAVKKGKARDSITLDSSGFFSEYYGRVDFGDIKTISGPNIWVQTPIAMIMKLHSGRKLTWALSDKSSLYNSTEDAQVFNQFAEALAKKLDLYYAAQSATMSLQGKSNAAPAAREHIANIKKESIADADAASKGSSGSIPDAPVDASTDFSRQNLAASQPPDNPARQLKKRITTRKAAKTAIPFASLIVLMLALKNCGIKYIREKKNREVREIFQYAEENYNNALTQARTTLDSIQHAAGSIFVYTNDSAASFQLIPDIQSEQADILSSVPVLAHGAMTDSLRRFAEHPDSFRYNILLKTGTGENLTVSKSALNAGDSAATWLYLSCYDPDLRVTDDGAVVQDTLGSRQHRLGKAFTFATGIPVYKDKPLLESMEGATLNLRMLLARTKFNKHYKVYLMAVSTMDQVSEELFQGAIRVFNRQLYQIKADTTAFHFSIR